MIEQVHHFDWAGFGVFLTSLGGFIVTVGGFIVITIRQNREYQANQRRELQSLDRDKKLAVIETNVNGMNKTIADTAHAAGKAEGVLIGAGAKAIADGVIPKSS